MIRNTEKPLVMAVDDTPANLELLQGILQKQGYRVAVFPRGAMALKAAAKNPPDLVLLDIMMPEMDGFEFCRRFKDYPELKEIPILFISALGDPANKVRAFSEGGLDYVTKPFQEEEVLARVNTHLCLHRAKKALELHNHDLKNLVKEKVEEISDSQLATILAVSKLTEYRDDDTGRHIERTQIFCKKLAQKLRNNPYTDISPAFIDDLYHAAPLHDIGKVGIPDKILLKPGKLTHEEFDIMKTHTNIGAATLEQVQARYPGNAFVNMGIALTRSHHEKWDGTGYPDGLAGKEIPLSGRIMALADVYDALRAARPYKKPFSHETACQIIREDAGTHFDPAVVDAFISLESEFEALYDRMKPD
ncbi:HD domain-containing phosphohydrolase [Desulfotignum balticum]|jgi:putative two-component system response regulator|uniref:HD domain-containing phosphohydrolase n=1 Tax=Desulfotignum balticum TaxID=115781 RepID=UPI00040FBC08|nr:HD domain-containing phosphohydrolase [Desulfotignum balticum]